MGHLAIVLLLVGLICSSVRAQQCSGNCDGWNFSPIAGVKTKEDAAMLSLVASFNGTEQDPRIPVWWASYKDTFYKEYTDNHSEANALSNFKASLNKIMTINSDLTVPYWLSGNTYSDLSFEQFKQTFLMTNISLPPAPPSGRRLRAGSRLGDVGGRRRLAASSVDWRSAGKLTPVKNQGSCGSCWAYSATAAVESSYLLAEGLNSQQTRIDLSEQQMIDCVGGGSSCNGGSSDSAIRYVNNMYQTTEDLYPSTYSDGTCRASGNPAQGTAVQLSSGTIYPGTWSESALMDAVATRPTVIYFEVDNDFYSYSGGIYYPTSCGTSINHAMVAVGYQWNGDSSSSYWIVRNSWGGSWGDYGYVYIQMTGDGAGPCGMYQYIFQAPEQFSMVLSTQQSSSPPPSTPSNDYSPPDAPANVPGSPNAPLQYPSAPDGPFGWVPFTPFMPFGWASAPSPASNYIPPPKHARRLA